MTRAPITDDMTDGYLDGMDLDMPEPSANRSATYRHGFRMGRNDRGKPFAQTAVVPALNTPTKKPATSSNIRAWANTCAAIAASTGTAQTGNPMKTDHGLFCPKCGEREKLAPHTRYYSEDNDGKGRITSFHPGPHREGHILTGQTECRNCNHVF